MTGYVGVQGEKHPPFHPRQITPTMPITDVAIKNAIKSTGADGKPLKLFDGGGLFLLITPAGGRYWRLKYRIAGKGRRR